jgi:hypothetical protein
MRIRAAVLTGLVTATALIVACGGNNDGLLGPTSVEAPNSQGPSAAPGGPGPALPPTGSCDASKSQFAIGKRAGSDLLERARVAAHAASARFVRPNEPITLEFIESRLTLSLDGRDIVISAHCS